MNDVELEKLFRKWGADRADASPRVLAGCPDDRHMAAYLAGGLDTRIQNRLASHFADCPACRRTLLAYQSSLDPQFGESAKLVAGPERESDPLDDELAAMEKALGMSSYEQSSAAGPPIMVVDDDPIYLQSLVSTLERRFDVVACSSGVEAMDRVSDRIGTVVLDIKMAGMSGLEVADRLNARFDSMPIIFNTGYPGEYLKSDIQDRFKPLCIVTKDHPELLMSCLAQASGRRTGAMA